MSSKSFTLDEALARIEALESKVNNTSIKHTQWEVLYNGPGGVSAMIGIPTWIKRIIVYGSHDVSNSSYLAKRYDGAPSTSMKFSASGNGESQVSYIKTLDEYMLFRMLPGEGAGDNGIFIIGTATDLYYKSVDQCALEVAA